MNGNRRSLLLAAPASLVLSACAGPSPATRNAVALPSPSPAVGDRWTYRLVNRYNGSTAGELKMQLAGASPLVLSVLRNEYGGAVASPGADLQARYQSPWAVTVEPSYDLVLQFAEPVPMLPPVLRVGERAGMHTRYSVPGYSGDYRWQQSLRAIREETVTVPAGTFKTLVIAREIWFDYPNWFRIYSTRSDTIWYAPEVNGWVRREWTGRYRTQSGMRGWYNEDWVRWELTDFRRGTAAS